MKKDVKSLVRSYVDAYHSRDRARTESLLAPDFTFTSPRDDHIGRDEYFQRCWPGGDQFTGFHVEKLFSEGDEAFLRYECRIGAGRPFRNTEYIRASGGKIHEIQVYFGAE